MARFGVDEYVKKAVHPCTCGFEEVEHWTVAGPPVGKQCQAHPDAMKHVRIVVGKAPETDYDREYAAMRWKWDQIREKAGLTTTRAQIREMTRLARNAEPERKRAVDLL